MYTYSVLGIQCLGRNIMGSPRQKPETVIPLIYVSLLEQSWTRKSALLSHPDCTSGHDDTHQCWTDYWWCVLILRILRILRLGSDEVKQNRGRTKLSVYAILQPGCLCILWSYLPGRWKIPVLSSSRDGSNWLAVGAQHCHIISNSYKSEFSYLTEFINYIFQPGLLSFLIEGEH